MERIDPEGKRTPLEPGEMARVDQTAAMFRDLSGQLMDIRDEFAANVLSGHPDAVRLAELNDELAGALTSAFVEKEDPIGGTFSFIMFLVDTLCTQRIHLAEIQERVGIAMRALVEIADLTEGRIPPEIDEEDVGG